MLCGFSGSIGWCGSLLNCSLFEVGEDLLFSVENTQAHLFLARYHQRHRYKVSLNPTRAPVVEMVALVVEMIASFFALLVSLLHHFVAPFKILSFSLFTYFSLSLRTASCLLGSFITSFVLLSIFIESKKRERLVVPL